MFDYLLSLLPTAPVAHCGHIEDNLEVRAHRSASANVTNFHIHKHRGNTTPPIDDLSPSFTQSEYDGLKSKAAQGFNPFDSEGDSVLGSWWDATLTTENKEQVQEIFKDL